MVRVTAIMIRLVITNSRFLMGLILSTRTQNLGNYIVRHKTIFKKLIDKSLKIANVASDARTAKQESDKFFIKGKTLYNAKRDLDIIEARYNKAVASYDKILDGISKARTPSTKKTLQKQLPQAKRHKAHTKTQYDSKKKKYTNALTDFETQIIDTYLAFKSLLASTGTAIS